MKPRIGFSVALSQEMTPISIPFETSSLLMICDELLVYRFGKVRKIVECLPTLDRGEMQRIGHAPVVIEEMNRVKSTPLQADWKGTIKTEGGKEPFISQINWLEAGNRYHVVYERTETLAGEPVIEIHDVIHESNRTTQLSRS